MLLPTFWFSVNKKKSLMIGTYCHKQLLLKNSLLLTNKQAATCLIFSWLWQLSLIFVQALITSTIKNKTVNVDNQTTKLQKHHCIFSFNANCLRTGNKYRAHHSMRWSKLLIVIEELLTFKLPLKKLLLTFLIPLIQINHY